MRIVGGIYRERSIFPEDDVIYGSGGRAAAALSLMNPNITLTSFVGENRRHDIEYHVKERWNIDLDAYPVPEIVSFTYYHGLSAPIIRPTQLPVVDVPEIRVSDDVVLQFGMLEGGAVINGVKVIYDPQNPERPERFDTNGSTAQELAYVVNRGEAYKLTGHEDVAQAAKLLLGQPNVAVVVIKSGAEGAEVFTAASSTHVGAYATNTIWSIGSGDVFAAVFAHFWGTENISPAEAAQYASKGAALYCGQKQIPLSRDALVGVDFAYPLLEPSRKPSDATIYLAGPFFTMSQLWLVEEARIALLHAGFNVFSPYHDVGIGDADKVVPADIKGIEDADVIFALCDGLDAGTLFEIGYAVKKGLPVVAFGEQTSDEAMKMLYGTNCKVFRDFTSAIYHAQWEALA
ncbi:MAG: nucleoside 2-deoxyribosyltransferase [Candidatus Thiodiazotropha sp. (ex Lucinoma borealis)]|nr:nucleoside 2-deoxyribosyltransferase [Candidatus Thiodiazotropha sp. (ex Lucinoma borealis)]